MHQAEVEAKKSERQSVTEAKKLGRTWETILGPTGKTYALKIAPRSGLVNQEMVDSFVEAGWMVYPAGTVAGKLGRPLSGAIVNPSDEDYFRILGPERQARAVVVALVRKEVDRATVEQWRNLGFDVGPAPKKFRDGAFQINPGRPAAERQALQAAREWFGSEDLVTEPERIPWTAPRSAVEIGSIVAIEYASDKWTGREAVYRHVFEEERRMAISTDGSTIVVFPPFRVTKRGIEG
jgi:hypothetical protein